VGDGLRQLKIPVYQVIAAQFCRTRRNRLRARLGPLEITEDLNHQIGQRQGLTSMRTHQAAAEMRPTA